MDTRKYSESHIKEWCEAHYPQVDSASDDIVLENKLWQLIIEGSALFDKYALQAHKNIPNNE